MLKFDLIMILQKETTKERSFFKSNIEMGNENIRKDSLLPHLNSLCIHTGG